jgi:hypothetical protein
MAGEFEYRRLGYELDRFWDSNNKVIVKLTRIYKIAATALVVEVVSLAALLGDTRFGQRERPAPNGVPTTTRFRR